MTETIPTTVALPPALLEQANALAQQLGISQSRLVELALEHFMQAEPVEKAGERATSVGRRIQQGDVYWLDKETTEGLEAGISHPHVVVQDDVLNHSRIPTVAMCALTTNLKRASLPGNVLLEAGEANLTRASVVEVAKVSAVGKAQLGEYIGTLKEERMQQILAGMRFLQESFYPR